MSGQMQSDQTNWPDPIGDLQARVKQIEAQEGYANALTFLAFRMGLRPPRGPIEPETASGPQDMAGMP
jgi:hypothetical protein